MLTPITVTSKIVNPDGSLATGGIQFVLMLAGQPVTIEDSSTGEIVSPVVVQAAIYQGALLANPQGGGPYLPFVLLANDDPTTIPVGSYYLVTEQLAAGSLPPWELTVPYNAEGGTITLASQRPTP